MNPLEPILFLLKRAMSRVQVTDEFLKQLDQVIEPLPALENFLDCYTTQLFQMQYIAPNP